jgi:hypothetical protein
MVPSVALEVRASVASAERSQDDDGLPDSSQQRPNDRIAMYRKKNRMINPEAKGPIIQMGQCPGCGRAVKFYYGEAGRFWPDCRKQAKADWKEERTERLNRRPSEKELNRRSPVRTGDGRFEQPVSRTG